MPIWEFECLECTTVFEKLYLSKEPGHPECPVCGSMCCKRLMSASNFELKGSGFYSTDYKPKGRVREDKDVA
jgi:putative FmdB family regulatory protein